MLKLRAVSNAYIYIYMYIFIKSGYSHLFVPFLFFLDLRVAQRRKHVLNLSTPRKHLTRKKKLFLSLSSLVLLYPDTSLQQS